MLCENNLFCSSLAPETRDELCRHCSKRTLTAGSTILSEDFSLKTNLVISGAMVTNTTFDDGIIQEEYDIPVFFLMTQGLLFPIEAVFMRKIPDQFSYNGLTCLTDCILARFDHDTMLGMFNSDPAFARSVLLNNMTTSAHASMFAATLRSYDVYQSVKWLLFFLSDKGVVLTHQQIADITTHNRTSVTKAIGAIKKREPELWARYASATERPAKYFVLENQPPEEKGKLPLLKKVLNYLSDIDIHTNPERCLQVRNRNVSCGACMNICPGNAISIEGLNVTVHPDRCLLCGACVASCPFDVFSAHNPTANGLAELVRKSAEITDGNPIVVCGHTHADLMGTYTPHVVRLNCLGRLDEDFYATIAGMELESMTLVHGSCRDCPRSTSGAQARRCFQAAQAALFAWEGEVNLRYTDKMPTEAYALTRTTKPSKGVKAPTSASSVERASRTPGQPSTYPGAETATPESENPRSIVSKIRARNGALAYHPSPRPKRVFDKLCTIGSAPEELPAMRFWGIPTFDKNRCQQCGLCAMFCETGAIKKIERFNYRKKKTLFAFEVEPFLCARCRCCEQVCRNDAIRIKPLEFTHDAHDRQTALIYERSES